MALGFVQIPLSARQIVSCAPLERIVPCNLDVRMAPAQGAYGSSHGGQGATSGFAGGYGQGQSSKYQGSSGYSQGGLYSAPQRGGRGETSHFYAGVLLCFWDLVCAVLCGRQSRAGVAITFHF